MTSVSDCSRLLRNFAAFTAFAPSSPTSSHRKFCSRARSKTRRIGNPWQNGLAERRGDPGSRTGFNHCPQALSGWEAAVDSGMKGVRVFQMDHQHSKHIFAEVRIHASVEQVWRVITDYDHLADFVPNLVVSERLPSNVTGRIHLRQIGCSQSVFWRLEAEAVLECVEVHKAMGAKELRFKAIEGDFQEYSGSWVVEPDPSAHTTTLLKYEISLQPKLSIPSAIVTCVVKAGLPANMHAMAKRAEQVAETKRKFPRFAAAAIADVQTSTLPWQTSPAAHQSQPVEQLPEAGPSRSICANLQPLAGQKRLDSMGYLGMISVPIPRLRTQSVDADEAAPAGVGSSSASDHNHAAAAPADVDGATASSSNSTHAAAASSSASAAAASEQRWRAAMSKTPAKKGDVWGRSPHLGVDWKCVSDASAVTEVHLRRLDGDDDLHRRVVAVLTVDATPQEVWQVLTDYESLPEVVPNLAVCERLQTPSGMSSRVTRLRQVGYKHMLYMSMHAEAIVDLVETEHQEVQFRQVQGDFSLLQGKFMLQEGTPERHILNGRVISKPQTHLKYAVEVQIPRDPLRLLGLVEPMIERMVYEDLPLNLGAIKTRVEENQQRSKVAELEAKGDTQRAAALRRRLDAPSDAELQNDVGALATELERCYQHLQRMPTRAELRADQRGYLERAISAHGGFGAVAGQIGWDMAYIPKRPRGYWDSILNVKSEVDEFIKVNGSQPGVVPSLREVRGADRADLARAIEKWGGPSQVAEELAYAVAPRKGRQASAFEPKPSAVHQEPTLANLPVLVSPVSTTKISVRPSSARTQTVGAKSGQQATNKQAKQQQDRGPRIPSPADLEAREKQPIVQNRRRLALRRKQPRLPTMRQEIDDW